MIRVQARQGRVDVKVQGVSLSERTPGHRLSVRNGKPQLATLDLKSLGPSYGFIRRGKQFITERLPAKQLAFVPDLQLHAAAAELGIDSMINGECQMKDARRIEWRHHRPQLWTCDLFIGPRHG